MSTSQREDEIDELERVCLELLVPLRAGDDYDPQALGAVLQQVEHLGEVWRRLDSIPKRAVSLLFELVPQLLIAADRRSEAARVSLNHAAAEVDEAIASMLRRD